MSLILKALEKAKSMAARKPAPPPHPAALASFRFGRPTKARRMRKLVILGLLPIVVVGAGAGYGIRYWLQKTSRPATVVVNMPPRSDTPVPDRQTEPRPATEATVPQPAPTPESAGQNAAPAPVQTASAVSTDAAGPPKPAPRRRRAVETRAPKPVDTPAEPGQNDVSKASDAAPNAGATTSAGAVAASASVPAPITVSHNGFELAVFYQRSGEYTKALEQYQKLLERDPLNASVYLNLGLLYQAMSNNLEALKAFRQAILINPNYDKAHNNLGIALMNSGQDAEAERADLRLEVEVRRARARRRREAGSAARYTDESEKRGGPLQPRFPV